MCSKKFHFTVVELSVRPKSSALVTYRWTKLIIVIGIFNHQNLYRNVCFPSNSLDLRTNFLLVQDSVGVV